MGRRQIPNINNFLDNIEYVLGQNNYNLDFKKRHQFHLVDASPWPFFSAVGALSITLNAVVYFHSYDSIFFVGLSVLYVSLIAAFWWRDVIREATFEGCHTKVVQQGLKLGMILFIVSEVMFFFSFFWAFFHSSLSPSIEIGCVWPPFGLKVFSPWGVPLLNTFILVLSGVSVTWAHHALLLGNYVQTRISLLITIFLAILFTNLQICEYLEAGFAISDGVYGSVFFMATGFHGFHVLIGTMFLSIMFIRFIKHHFSQTHHIGFEAAIWYWHFVDVVWLVLFISIYWWGNQQSFLGVSYSILDSHL
jgi:cytochrome c oxidase subunit 3